MLLFLLAYLGGVLTILSPCILPVLPFVFARANQPFLRSGLPMLIGMAATFALVATLAAVAGGWAVQANEYGRWAALALLVVFGLALLFPSFSERLTQPLVTLGDRISTSADQRAEGGQSSILLSALLGVATGLLWAPCAGPVLGLILAGAALHGANFGTTLALLAYALGAGTSLALALLVGGRIYAAMKRSLGVGEWVRRAVGAAVLAGVAAIALGLDTGVLANLSYASTASLEQTLVDGLHAGPSSNIVMKDGPAMMAGNPSMMKGGGSMAMSNVAMNGAPSMMAANPTMMKSDAKAGGSMAMSNVAMSGAPAMMMKAKPAAEEALPVEGQIPSLAGAVEWLNSPPLTAAALKGKVVLVDFWTYSCINCIRSIPYIRAWAEKYRDKGLVVIGVHAPEFAFEKKPDNVKKAVADLKISYPVALDNDYKIWNAFGNEYWPAHYFIDAEGRIRHHHFGEGEYDESERVIQQLLAEAGAKDVAPSLASVQATGAEAAADEKDVRSEETYVGYARAENFASPGGAVHDASHLYTPPSPSFNQWGLSGDWTVGKENAKLNATGGSIVYDFHARDLHLVMGPGQNNTPVHFRVTIDGEKPGERHGVDTDADGLGVVDGQRLYQLVRDNGAVSNHTFRIEFLDPGVEAYAFTFG